MRRNGKSFDQVTLRSVVTGLLANYTRCGTLDVDALVSEMVNILVAHGVRCIAADFDHTLTLDHSHGCTLPEYDAPFFRALSRDFDRLAALAQRQGMKIAVVTFSDPEIAVRRGPQYISGELMIRKVVELSHGMHRPDLVIARYPPYYMEESEWRALGLSEAMPNSKSYHLQQVRAAFNLMPEQILFLDDDDTNCAIALQEGYPTIQAFKGFDFTRIGIPLTPQECGTPLPALKSMARPE